MPIPLIDSGKRATEFSPPRAKMRPVLDAVDPPSENRARMPYPYGEHFQSEAE